MINNSRSSLNCFPPDFFFAGYTPAKNDFLFEKVLLITRLDYYFLILSKLLNASIIIYQVLVFFLIMNICLVIQRLQNYIFGKPDTPTDFPIYLYIFQ